MTEYLVASRSDEGVSPASEPPDHEPPDLGQSDHESTAREAELEDAELSDGELSDDEHDSAQDARRAALVAAAQAGWIGALTDLGGRNTLLYFKNRRAGTLDLAAAGVISPVGQRPGPRPAAQRAPSAPRLAVPPAVVHELVPESRR
jgi:hypothetical protein